VGKTITLTLPDDMLAHFEQAASLSNRTLEEEVTAMLVTMYFAADDPDVLTEQLNRVSEFPDNYLWALVERHLSPHQESRYYELTDKHKSGQPLSPDEKQEHQKLLDLLTVQMLWRSAALAELKTRGYKVGRYFNQPDE
jgi:hypothetical protein